MIIPDEWRNADVRGAVHLRAARWTHHRWPAPARTRTKCGTVVSAFRARTTADPGRVSCPRCRAAMVEDLQRARRRRELGE